MRKIRVVVEVSVPDNHPLTEHQLAHRVIRELVSFSGAGALYSKNMYIGDYGRKDWSFRRFDVKELRRVNEYRPGGIRNPTSSLGDPI